MLIIEGKIKEASTVDLPFLKPNCFSEILVLLSYHRDILLFSTLVKSLLKLLNKVIPLELMASYLLPFLCIGIINPRVQASVKTPLSSISKNN